MAPRASTLTPRAREDLKRGGIPSCSCGALVRASPARPTWPARRDDFDSTPLRHPLPVPPASPTRRRRAGDARPGRRKPGAGIPRTILALARACRVSARGPSQNSRRPFWRSRARVVLVLVGASQDQAVGAVRFVDVMHSLPDLDIADGTGKGSSRSIRQMLIDSKPGNL